MHAQPRQQPRHHRYRWPSTEQEKTAEPWILAGDLGDLTGRELRLVVCAYIRPEARAALLGRWRVLRACRQSRAPVAANRGSAGPSQRMP